MKTYIKKLFSNLFLTMGLVGRKIENRSCRDFVVVMYHRILPPSYDTLDIEPGMYVLTETLSMHLKFLDDNFHIRPLSEVLRPRENHQNIIKPTCYITFDDGWLDFYKFAYPILIQFGVHATVFLPTGFIGTENRFWTDRLLDIFKKVDHENKIYLRDVIYKNKYVKDIVSIRGNYEEITEKAISILKKVREEEIDDILSELTLVFNVDVMSTERAFINWNEAYEMKQSKLIDFGSHTVNHKILTTLRHDEIVKELRESKEKLMDKKINDGEFVPFCYPSGVYDKKIAKMVQEAGYDLAVSTQKGWNSLKEHPFNLRRIGIHQDMTSTPAMFACKIAGIF